MSTLTPFETLYAAEQGQAMSLPTPPADVYGCLRLPLRPGQPYVVGNFVTTLDGVVSLNIPGQAGGGEISGFNQHDRLLMGLLRAVADVVIVGAGTLRAVPRHVWTPAYVNPPLAQVYRQLRAVLGKPEAPLNVIVTASGALDLNLRVFQSGEAPVLIVTTAEGAQTVGIQAVSDRVKVAVVDTTAAISAQAILDSISRSLSSEVVLVEGGPQLMGDFFAEHCLDELFLTLAPQMAGRDSSVKRPGLVADKLFAPEHPLWGTLVGIRRAASHLFLRYQFERVGG